MVIKTRIKTKPALITVGWPSLSSCVSHGDTFGIAVTYFREIAEGWLAAIKQHEVKHVW